MGKIKYELFTSQQEDVKFHAFFQYLRSFSETGMATLNKLENDFNKEIKKRLNEHQILALHKNILSAYEIFALEMKDSCDFVELNEFGTCISKTFLQLIKIIKWFLRSWIKNTGQEKKIQLERTSKGTENGPVLCSFCQEVIKAGTFGRDTRGKRKAVALDIEDDMKEAKNAHRKERNHLYELKSQVLDRCTQRQIESKRFIQDEMELLNRKHVALKMEISNNQTVLEEILNQFSMKTEAIARFLTTTQVNCFEDFQLTRDQEYHSFEQQMKLVIEKSHQQATVKLRQIILTKLKEMELKRLSNQEEIGIQVQPSTDFEKERLEIKVKHLTAQLVKQRRETEQHRQLADDLKNMLASKSVQFQEEFTKYRQEIFGEKRKLDMLKSIKNFADFEEEVEEEGKVTGSIVLDRQDSSQGIRPLFKKIVNGQRVRSRKQIENLGEDDGNEESEQRENLAPWAKLAMKGIVTQTEGRQFASRGVNTDCRWQDMGSSAFSDLKSCSPKRRAQLYSHVGSRVYNIVPKQNIPSPPKKKIEDIPQSFSLVRKLATEAAPSKNFQQVTCHSLAHQPRFSLPSSNFTVGKQDIENLFLNDQNAQSYEFMFYNHHYSPPSLNPRRKVQMARRSQADPVVSDNTDGRIIRALFRQLQSLRKRQKQGYEQVKALLRSPWELSQKLDILHLEGLGSDKDIELGELIRMVGLIMRFHSDCIGCKKDTICCHISDFSSHIGANLI